MRKCLKRLGICFLTVLLVFTGSLIADKQRLREELIRLHVVAASDDPADQALKLQVRDAVTESLKKAMTDIQDPEAAKAYLQEHLPVIAQTANRVLEAAGCPDRAVVTLAPEAFDTRVYDTFSLPAGIYEALRITIGEGEGKNWWCVVFPTLCIPATSEGFEETANCAGFPDALTAALQEKDGYELRFFLLDAFGELEIFLNKE